MKMVRDKGEIKKIIKAIDALPPGSFSMEDQDVIASGMAAEMVKDLPPEARALAFSLAKAEITSLTLNDLMVG